MAISDFCFVLYLNPEIRNFDLSKIVFVSITQHFQVIQKFGIDAIEIHTNNTHPKLQSNIFIFGCAIAKKTAQGDDVTF